MKRVFADTGYWVALLNPSDQLHERAMAVSRACGAVRIYTTEMVFVEVANMLGKTGETFRAVVKETIVRLRQDPNITFVPQTSAQFREALDHYATHRDKDWSLTDCATDCASFLIMKEERITEALAHDHHFEQAGFKALLR
jgi:predicted nucleic acid-binding protein